MIAKIIKEYTHTPREIFKVGDKVDVSKGTLDILLAGKYAVIEKKPVSKVEKKK